MQGADEHESGEVRVQSVGKCNSSGEDAGCLTEKNLKNNDL